MKNKIIHSLKLYNILVLMAIISISVACDSDDDYKAEGPTRMFTPGRISVQSFEDRAELTWEASLFTSGIDEVYIAQVSEDSLFGTASEIILEKSTDTTGIVITDQELQVRQDYFVRLKVDALEDRPESKWSDSRRFSIRGVQKLFPVISPDILSNRVTIKWEVTEGVTELRFQEYTQDITDPTSEPVNVGEPIIVTVSQEEAAAATKMVDSLKPDTRYFVDLYKGNTSIGYRSFKTKVESDYTKILNPEDDIVTIVNESQNGDVIGLEPGVYDATGANFVIDGKTIVLQSTSNDPHDTKVSFSEFTLNDSGAGITLRGLELDGSSASYLINLTSSNGNSDAAAFTSVLIDNCIVYGVGTSAFRANRGPDGGYSMESFDINYSTFYDFAPGSYAFLHVEELVIEEFNLSNSTFYRTGDLFIRYRKAITPAPNPVFNINYCTINSIGFADNYTLLDAGDVQTTLNFRNSILANVPRPGGTARTDLIRMSNITSSASFTFSNFFNLTDGNVDDPSPVVIPQPSEGYITSENMYNINLSWDNSTTNFTIPASSPLQTASSNGGPIGDPRWWY